MRYLNKNKEFNFNYKLLYCCDENSSNWLLEQIYRTQTLTFSSFFTFSVDFPAVGIVVFACPDTCQDLTEEWKEVVDDEKHLNIL